MKNRAFRKFVASIGVAAMVMSTATNALSPAVTKAESAQELEGQQNDSQEQSGQEDPVAQSSDDANGAPFADAEPMAVSSDDSQNSQEAAGPSESSDSNGENGAEGSSGENTNASADSTSTDASGAESQGAAGTMSGATNGTAGTMSGATNGTSANGTSANTSTDAANGTSADASTGTTTGENGEASGDNAEASTKEITSVITEDIDLGTYPAGEAPAYAQLELPDEIEVKVDEEKQTVTVTWNGEETYHPDQAGTYIFSSELDKEWNKDENGNARYQLAEKVELPKASVRVEKKAESKEENKTDVKSDNKTENKTDAKLDNKTDSKTDAKADSKKDSKTDAKADSKSEGKTEEKSDNKSEVTTKPETTKDTSKETAKDTSKENTKETSKKDSTSKDKTKDETKGETKDKTKDETKAETQTDTKDESAKADQKKKKKVTNAASLKAVYVAEDGTVLCGTVGLTGDFFTISDKAKSFNGYELKTVTLGEEELPQDTAFTRNTSTTETKEEIRTEASYTYTMDGAEHEIAAGDTATITFTYAQKEEVTPEIASIEVTGEAVDTTGAAIQGDYAFPLAVGTNDLSKTAPYIQGYEYQYAEIGTDKITSIDKEVLEAGKYAYYVDGELLKENTKITYVYQEDEDYTEQLTGTCGNLTVNVSAKKDAKIPEGTIVRVSPIESARMSQIMAKISETLGQDPDNVIGVLYDISLDKDGEEIQPKESVHVTMKFDGGIPWNVPEEKQIADTKVVHMHGGETDVVAEAAEDGNAEFETESFSTYVLMATYGGENSEEQGGGDQHNLADYMDSARLMVNGKEIPFKNGEATIEFDPKNNNNSFGLTIDWSIPNAGEGTASRPHFQIKKGTKFTYKLPSEITYVDKGNVKKDGEEIGTYTIDADGNLVITFNKDMASNVKGTFALSGTFKRDYSQSERQISFDGIGTLNIKNKNSIDVKKDQISNENGKLKFKITVTSHGKNENITLKDVITGELKLEDKFIVKKGNEEIGGFSVDQNGDKEFTISGLNANDGDELEIYYYADLQDGYIGNVTRNEVFQEKTKKTEWSKTWNKTQIYKRGEFDEKNDCITWTITIYRNDLIDLAGTILKDTLGDGLQKAELVSAKYCNENGKEFIWEGFTQNELNELFAANGYAFPGNSKANKYVIEYKTKVNRDNNENKERTNKVVLTPPSGNDAISKDPSVNVEKYGELTKTPSDENTADRKLKWEVTYTPSTTLNEGVVATDTLGGWWTVSGIEHLFPSDIQFRAVCDGKDVTNDFKVNIDNADRRKLTITLNDGKKMIGGKKYIFQYSSEIVGDNDPAQWNNFTNEFKVNNNFKASGKYNWNKENKESISKSVDSRNNELVQKGKLGYRIDIPDIDSLEKDKNGIVTIPDFIPNNTSFDINNAELRVLNDWTEIGNDNLVAVEANEKGISFSIHVNEIKAKYPSLKTLRIQYALDIVDKWTDAGNNINYKNTIVYQNKEISCDYWYTLPKLVTKTAQYASNSDHINYTIVINEKEQQSNGGKDITLDDELGTFLTLNVGSVNFSPSEGCSYSLKDETGRNVTFTVPDGKKITITYSAKVLKDAVTGGQQNKFTYDESYNKVSVKGKVQAEVSEKDKYVQSSSTATDSEAHISLQKYGKGENGAYLGELGGAKFALYKEIYNDDGKVTSEVFWEDLTENSIGSGKYREQRKLEKGSVYRLVETEAPSGYAKAEDIYFTIIGDSGKTVPLTIVGLDSKSHSVDRPASNTTNTYTVNVGDIKMPEGSLKLEKKIGDGSPASAKDKTYQFTVKTSDGKYVHSDGTFSDQEVTIDVKPGTPVMISDLPVGEYTVAEKTSDETQIIGYTLTVSGGGTATVSKGETATAEITNTYTPEKVQVSGSKNWNDDGNAAGTRPGSITIRLYANGSEIGHKTVTEKDGWSWNWTGLNRYDTDHKEISYTISEDAVDGYTSSISGYNVTNTVNKPQVGSVILTKVDATTGTALAGAVFDLYRANNTKVGTYTTNAGGVLRVDGLTFGDYYFVETKAPEGYALESQRAAFTINAATTVSAPASVRVTNKPVDEKIGVSATKVWDDENNTDGVRPSSVTFRLFADGVEIGSAQASEANGWTVSFGNLPKTRNGAAISYAVKEDEVGNYYEASYETGLGSDGSYVFTVKNYRETDKHYEERTGSVRGANRNKPSNGGVAGAGRGRGTGDESDMTVYGTVSGASLLALIVWMIARRKRAGKGTK